MYRKTNSFLAPIEKTGTKEGHYDLFPAFRVQEPIYIGLQALADKISNQSTVIIEGAEGVLWDMFIHSLEKELIKMGKKPTVILGFNTKSEVFCEVGTVLSREKTDHCAVAVIVAVDKVGVNTFGIVIVTIAEEKLVDKRKAGDAESPVVSVLRSLRLLSRETQGKEQSKNYKCTFHRLCYLDRD